MNKKITNIIVNKLVNNEVVIIVKHLNDKKNMTNLLYSLVSYSFYIDHLPAMLTNLMIIEVLKCVIKYILLLILNR